MLSTGSQKLTILITEKKLVKNIKFLSGIYDLITQTNSMRQQPSLKCYPFYHLHFWDISNALRTKIRHYVVPETRNMLDKKKIVYQLEN